MTDSLSLLPQPRFYSIMPMSSGKDYVAREVEVAQPLMAAAPVGGNQGGDFIVQPIGVPAVVGSLACNTGPNGNDAGNFGCNQAVDAGHVFAVQSVALRGREGGATAELGGETAYALRAAEGGGSDPYVLAPIPLNPNVLRGGEAKTPSPDAEGRVRLRNPSFGVGQPGDPADTLQAAGSGMVAVCVTGDITHTLKAEGFDGSGRGQPIIAFHATQDSISSCSLPLEAKGRGNGLLVNMAVRRLMPVECEALQGFPRNYTLVPVGKKMAADGPRYKQLGNSWAVPHARWVGSRVAAEFARLDALDAARQGPAVDVRPALWLLAA